MNPFELWTRLDWLLFALAVLVAVGAWGGIIWGVMWLIYLIG